MTKLNLTLDSAIELLASTMEDPMKVHACSVRMAVAADCVNLALEACTSVAAKAKLAKSQPKLLRAGIKFLTHKQPPPEYTAMVNYLSTCRCDFNQPGLLEAEIKGTTQHVEPGFFNRVVKKRARRTGIDDISVAQFIQNSGLYNSDAKQWKNITKTTVEKDLYPHFLKIFQQVVATFHVKEREVIATFNIKIKHIEGSLGDSKLKTSPDLFFYGSGPNFHPEGLQLELKDKADYRYCASPCEIKTEHNLSEEGVVTQVGVYARQCFIQQGNRHYVYSLVMTEKRVFLLQFDRNGILRGEYVDIHENPVDFVYLILLVSSPNCTTLGFDTSVYWRGDKRYIKTLNEDGKRVEYEIINSEPFFQRRTIRGRGTLCWLGRDPRGILRIIKDSWQAQGRNPEADLLEELKGVPGVGQMIAFEPEKLTIAGLRGMNDKALPSGMVDRLFRRIILKAYGNQIEDFANPKQFLYAFRDAVAGHKSMWDMNIIHRDISVNNILVGEEGAEEGWRGVVIDMDMAVRWQREHTMAAVDFRTGTRAFQALLVIGSEQDKAKGVVILPHDHMDDLESFFYVFSWVCMGRNQYGQPVKCAVLEHWEGDNLQDVFVHKENFLVSKSVNPKHDEVIHNFGPIFQNLFDGLRVLVRDNYFWKDNNRDKIPRTLVEMKPRSDKDYAAFLGLINEALERLEEQERKEEGQNEDRMQHLLAEGRPISPDDPSSSPTQSPASSPTRTPSRSHQQTGSSSSMKRTRDERDAGVTEMDIDGEEALPVSKRLQTSSLSQSQPEEVLVRAVQEAIAGAAPEAAPAPRRSSRLRTGSSQSVHPWREGSQRGRGMDQDQLNPQRCLSIVVHHCLMEPDRGRITVRQTQEGGGRQAGEAPAVQDPGGNLLARQAFDAVVQCLGRVETRTFRPIDGPHSTIVF